MRVNRIVLIASLATATVLAQTPKVFDVASIHVSRDVQGGYLKPSPDGLTAHNIPLRNLVSWAWDLRSDLIFGPNWIDSEKFDISAKASETIPLSVLRPMLASLLGERFRLQTHRESRELPVYALVVPRKGMRDLVKATTEEPGNMQPEPGGADGQHWLMKNITMAKFALFLAEPALGRPVVDMTELPGGYDFSFMNPKRDPAMDRQEHQISVVFPAVFDQLGLKVEARKAATEVLVIDQGEKLPTEN